MSFFIIISTAIVITIISYSIFYFSTASDKKRIHKDASDRKWKVLKITWEPHGPGHVGSRDRIYSVEFIDDHGKLDKKYCKTSEMSNVYWK